MIKINKINTDFSLVDFKSGQNLFQDPIFNERLQKKMSLKDCLHLCKMVAKIGPFFALITIGAVWCGGKGEKEKFEYFELKNLKVKYG